ncbi:MAG: LptF/LptG family permease [Candidatus Omnitrophota bacterium]|nr:MAG: LptF/LptG family permease [Candidatus Omnitrophota bacterium]
MKILRTYLLKELFWPFILSLAILIFIMLIGSLVNLFNLVVNKGVSLGLVVKLIFLLIPNILTYALPLSILSATLLTIGRLSADNEIVAIRASGINLYRLCFPIIIVGLVASLASIPINDKLKPRALFASRKIVKQIGMKTPAAFLEAGTFIRSFQNYIIFIYGIHQNKLSNIRIYQPQEGKATRTIIANEGEFLPLPEKDIIKLKLINGSSDEPNPKDPGVFYKLNFKTYYLTLDISDDTENMQKKLKDMSVRELRQKMHELQKENIEVTPIVTEINKKLSFSFSTFAFVILGLPLAICTRRREKFVGIGLSIGVFVAYYVLFLTGEVLSVRGLVYPGLSMWLANIALTAAGLILIFHTNKR